MSEESQEDRTEAASPKRRQDFRNRGEVAKSQELASAFMLAGGLAALLLLLLQARVHLGPAIQGVLARLDERENLFADMGGFLAGRGLEVLLTLGPPLLLLTVVAILAHLAQIGPLFSTQALAFRPEKLNPIPGIQRMFMSKDALANLIQTFAKVSLIGCVAAISVLSMRDELISLVGKSPADLGRYLVKVAAYPLAASAGVMLVVGSAHFAWQRHSMNERMKSTKADAKREHKESEGDPLVRRRRRRRHQDQLNVNRLIDAVPDADVIITNPTHVSVALRYRAEAGAPVVVAKGLDFRALTIRQIADENGVPIIENPPLARALHGQVEVGRRIPEDFFRAVSEVLAFVMRHKGLRHWRDGTHPESGAASR